MLKKLIEVNRALKKENLVMFTWGNASCRSYENNIFIKPSGIPFEELKESDMSNVNLLTGRHIEGLKPSVDTPTHVVLYNDFPEINAVIHTHSKYCTIFAQSKLGIPCLGTTHADYFYGNVPVVGELDTQEINKDYEENIGLKIVQYFKENKLSPLNMQAALVPSHGVFVWGETLDKALKNAIILENVAEMAYKTLTLCYNKSVDFNTDLLNKHFLRKHGKNRYYGQ
jgi:L-ribulose-5-phosphate 4-epimerase